MAHPRQTAGGLAPSAESLDFGLRQNTFFSRQQRKSSEILDFRSVF
jgi:hypothetical protein